MPTFKYTAKNLNGEIAEGTYDATSVSHVAMMLRQRKFFPVAIEKFTESKDVSELDLFSNVTVKDIAFLCRQFSTLISAGLPIIQIMDILSLQNMNRKLKIDLIGIADNVRTGRPLSDSMRQSKNFPELLVNMVQAGELGGTLDKVLDRMATHYEKEYKVRQKLKNALAYPSFVLVITAAVVYFLLTSVVPTFSNMFENFGLELPVTTRILLGLSAFVVSHGIFVVIGLICIALLFRIMISKGQGRYNWHKILLKLPGAGKLLTLVISSRFTRTLSTLLGSGTALLEALEMTKKIIGNACVEKGIELVQERIRSGEGLWGPLQKLEIFPPMLVQMIRVGEESGTLDNLLLSTAYFYEEETEGYIAKLTSLVEPILILVLAVIVGFVVLSIALPMFDMMGAIG